MRGLLNGGQSVLGFDRVPEKKNTYTVNEDEAAMVKIIFKTFLEQGTLSRSIRKLSELGVHPKVNSTRKNKLVDRGIWSTSTLRDLLRNQAYVGLREVNKSNRNLESKSLKSHEHYQVVKASWPAIVNQNVFDSVQKLLLDNLQGERRRLDGAERRVFLVSGILHCKECGRPMVGQSAHGEKSVHRYYKHSSSLGDVITCSVKRIRAEDVEAAISRNLFELLNNGGYLTDISSRISAIEKENFGSDKALKSQLEKDLKNTDSEMEAAFKFQLNTASGTQALQFYTEKIESLGTEKLELKRQIESLKELGSNVISISEAKKNLYERTESVTRGWPKLPDTQKRRALRRLIKDILIGPEGMDIYYYYNSLSEERSLGMLALENESLAKVLNFKGRRNDSKLSVENCPLGGMVTMGRIELPT